MSVNILVSEDKFRTSSNSAAEFSIRDVDGHLHVIKTTEASHRNSSNLQKQKEFAPLPNILAVPIIKVERGSKTITAHMPFQAGLVGCDYAIAMAPCKSDIFKKRLDTYFNHFFPIAVRKPLPRSRIIEKIKDLKRCSLFSQSQIKILHHLIYLVENVESYPSGFCHGDLTLSNIIFNKDDNILFLIDFLQVYIDSPLIDLAKIEQDLKYGWSCRFESAGVITKAQILGQYLLENFNYVEKEDLALFNIISFLNTARILPYCDDDQTFHWVQETMRAQEVLL